MNDTTARTISSRRWTWLSPLALVLSLTACEPGDEGTLRVRYGETWKEFTEERAFTFRAGDFPLLRFCGTNDPIPEAIDDETALCIDVELDAAIPGSGPATFTLDGLALVPDPQSRVERVFNPGPEHSAGVTGVWANTSCFGPPAEQDVTHQVSGQLELEENSATRLKGRLVVNATGTTGGSCPGNAVEADVRFDIER